MDKAALMRAAGRERPVLIAGPTASGKSALALEIAERLGGRILNADALQVFADWRVLTARPTPQDEARAPHALYGHVPGDQAYSVGHWLRDLAPYLSGGPRPIVVGGTGLYFAALTEGLAAIPDIPEDIAQTARQRLGAGELAAMLAELDAETASRIDRANPRRVQRAWEVLAATGRGLAAWQDDTGPPLLPRANALPLLIEADRDWLAARIAQRFQIMLATGALDEARAQAATWDPAQPSAKAIGAADLVAHVQGRQTLAEAENNAIVLTRQYAKRQRSWFRSRMKDWISPTLFTA